MIRYEAVQLCCSGSTSLFPRSLDAQNNATNWDLLEICHVDYACMFKPSNIALIVLILDR